MAELPELEDILLSRRQSALTVTLNRPQATYQNPHTPRYSISTRSHVQVEFPGYFGTLPTRPP